MTEPLEPDQPTQPEALPDVEPVGPEQPDESPEQPDEKTDAEEADESTEGEPSTDEPPAEGEGQQQQALYLDKERQEKVHKSFETYARAVGKHYEEDANGLQRCPLCPDNFPGFVLPEDAGLMPQAIKDAVQLFLGVPRAANYQTDATKPACDTCQGLGKVKTGSKVPGQDILMCATCSGKGWVGAGFVYSAGSDATAPQPVAVASNGEAVQPADVDAFGSPRLLDTGMENPNYGRMPQYKDPALP